DLELPRLKLTFKEKAVTFGQIKCGSEGKPLGPSAMRLWNARRSGDKDFGPIAMRLDGKVAQWNHKFVYDNEASLTLTAALRPILFDQPRHVNDAEVIRIQS